MNILYYGANDTINDIAINKINNNKIINNTTRTYKNIKYYENINYLTFYTINPIILQFIKSIIQTKTITNIIRKILILNIEQLDKDSFVIFRILIENFNNTTIFIATTTKISFIDKPTLSRFNTIRIPIPTNILFNITPVSNIFIKPSIIEIKILTKKCKNFRICDVINDLLKITPYKKQFLKTSTDIESQFNFHKNKELALEAILLVCFYPPKYDIKTFN